MFAVVNAAAGNFLENVLCRTSCSLVVKTWIFPITAMSRDDGGLGDLQLPIQNVLESAPKQKRAPHFCSAPDRTFF
jgi:hypothetical protein